MVRSARTGTVSTRTGLAVYVALLPEGDPDEMARADPDRLRGILSQAKPVLEHVIDRVAGRHDLAGPDDRRRFLAEVLPLLSDEPDALTRELYLGRLATLTGVPQEALRDEAQRAPKTAPRRPATGPAPTPAAPEARVEQGSVLERSVMAQLVSFPEEAARVDLAPEDLVGEDHRAISEHLRAKRPTSDLPAHLAAIVAALGAMGAEPPSEVDAARELRDPRAGPQGTEPAAASGRSARQARARDGGRRRRTGRRGGTAGRGVRCRPTTARQLHRPPG